MAPSGRIFAFTNTVILNANEQDSHPPPPPPPPPPPVGDGFITEWTVAGDASARTITLPLYNLGTFNCVVSWGDGSADSTITSWNDVDKEHTYASDGTYNVEIIGECPAWSFSFSGDKLKITDIIYWGDTGVFGGFQYLTGGFMGCTNLKSLGPIGSKILSNPFFPLESLQYAFFDCELITSIPAGIFDYNTAISDFGFESTFEGCHALTTIPTDLFKYNILVYFRGFSKTFMGCSGLTGSIPTDLFRYNTLVADYAFDHTFYNCTSITAIPTDLFRYNTAVSTYGFELTFSGCSGLTTIPANLFDYNTAVSIHGFVATFEKCTSITAIPTDLFRYNTAVSTYGFVATFNGCSNLVTVPELLFKYNINATDFSSCFDGCIKMQQNAKIFYDTGEHTTRFLNKTVYFYSCFYRSSGFSGSIGTAPDLWNCDFGTGTPTKTDCWGGTGNSTTSLTNYGSIPLAWK